MQIRSRVVLGVLVLALGLLFFGDGITLVLLRHRPAARPDASAEPLQAATDAAPFERRIGGRRYRITPRFRYDQSARVVSSRAYRWGREGTLLPEDLALAWGPMIAPPYAGKLSFSQFSRFFFWRTKDLSLDRGTIVGHTANVHVLPRTVRLKHAVRSLGKGDLVRMEGFLVDVDGLDDPDFHWGTSTTRSDEGPRSCETIYLERLTVGKRAYE